MNKHSNICSILNLKVIRYNFYYEPSMFITQFSGVVAYKYTKQYSPGLSIFFFLHNKILRASKKWWVSLTAYATSVLPTFLLEQRLQELLYSLATYANAEKERMKPDFYYYFAHWFYYTIRGVIIEIALISFLSLCNVEVFNFVIRITMKR